VRALLALCLALAGCAGERPANGDRASGHPTVVSLNPCTDAIAAELAAPGQLLAISHYSHDPAASSMDAALARTFPATGGTVEEVLALDPDLVVAGSFLPPATRRALEALGMKVETFGIASSVAQSQAQVRRMAALLGEPARGAALADRIAAAVAAARPARGSPPIDAVLWQPGEIVPGSDTLIGELMRAAGLASHSAARGMGQGAYLPLETLLADPPRLLLLAGRARGQSHPALAQVEGMRIARFDPALLYCGGPTIIHATARLAQIREGAA